LRGYYPGEREHRQRSQPRARAPRIPHPRGREPGRPKPPRRRGRGDRKTGSLAFGAGRAGGRRLDWVIGIALGIALGIGIVVAFLLFGSEGTIDAPRIHGVRTGKAAPARSAPARAAPAAAGSTPAGRE
jgi:hypothetical protein